MKLLNIALLLVAIQSDGKSGAGLTTVDAATPYLRADLDVEVHKNDILKSDSCKPFVKEATKEMTKILKDFTEDQIEEHMCDPVTLEEKLYSVTNATDKAKTELNPCAKELQYQLGNFTAVLQDYAYSKEACIAGTKEAFKQYNKGVDEIDCCLEFLVGSWTSDKNLKTNINFVGMSAWGIPTYTFKYREGAKNFSGCALDTESTYFGAMAQDLLELAPEAVTKSKVNGYYAVDYSKIDVDFYKIA